MSSLSDRIAASKPKPNTVPPPAPDGDSMSLASLDLLLMNTTIGSAAASSSSAPTPIPTMRDHVEHLHSLIDQWGANVHVRKDATYTDSRASMIENLLYLKNICVTALLRSEEPATPSLPTLPTISIPHAASLHLSAIPAAASSSVSSSVSVAKSTRSKTTSPAAPPRVREYCQCKSDQPCGTKHCKCRKAGGSCGPSCLCKNTCMNSNFIPPAPGVVGIEPNRRY